MEDDDNDDVEGGGRWTMWEAWWKGEECEREINKCTDGRGTREIRILHM